MKLILIAVMTVMLSACGQMLATYGHWQDSQDPCQTQRPMPPGCGASAGPESTTYDYSTGGARSTTRYRWTR